MMKGGSFPFQSVDCLVVRCPVNTSGLHTLRPVPCALKSGLGSQLFFSFIHFYRTFPISIAPVCRPLQMGEHRIKCVVLIFGQNAMR